MIYEYDSKTSRISPHRSAWNPKELELERLKLTGESGEDSVLNEMIFGEPLLLLKNQVWAKTRKRVDILALDRNANGVIIELKRDTGILGVETQALQYLADFSHVKGAAFIQHFSKSNPDIEDRIHGFVGDGIRQDDINRNSRIILVAQAFVPALFSMGEWLAEHGISFRCITYSTAGVENRRRVITFTDRLIQDMQKKWPQNKKLSAMSDLRSVERACVNRRSLVGMESLGNQVPGLKIRILLIWHEPHRFHCPSSCREPFGNIHRWHDEHVGHPGS